MSGPSLQAMALALVDLGFVSVRRAQEIVSGILHKQLAPSQGVVGKVQKKASRLLQDFLKEQRNKHSTWSYHIWASQRCLIIASEIEVAAKNEEKSNEKDIY